MRWEALLRKRAQELIFLNDIVLAACRLGCFGAGFGGERR